MSESAAVGSRGNAGRQRPALRRENEAATRLRRAGRERMGRVALRPIRTDVFGVAAARRGMLLDVVELLDPPAKLAHIAPHARFPLRIQTAAAPRPGTGQGDTGSSQG